jgi:microcin C transport system substrate-binding protein
MPTAGELKILGPFRKQLSARVFEPAYVPPKTDGAGHPRQNLREAKQLLASAGWRVEGGVLVDGEGKAFEVEFLLVSAGFERVVAPLIRNLEILGIRASQRLVDPAQYERRRKSYDFDIVSARFTFSSTPGPELRNYFASFGASQEGTNNLSGIDDPVVDALIEKVVAADTREDLTTSARALDRVLRAGHYWIPHWYKAEHHIAHWDKFGWPEQKPKYQRGIMDTWWIDAQKATDLKQD